MVPATYVFSPSQIDTYNACTRKWAYKTIAKVRTEQHPSAALGTATHKQLENYLSGGQLDYHDPNESAYIAAAGLQHLPDPKTPGLILEGFFKFQSDQTGFWYNGYRDFYIPASSRPEGRPLVGDHKTTSNISNYAKTAQDLQTDPQAIIYARNEGDTDVDLQWIYYQTRGTRKSLSVLTTLSKEHVAEQFATLELTAQNMRGILDESRSADGDLVEFVKTLPPNPSACERYGGCPYRHLCQLGPEDRLNSLFGKQLTIMENQMTNGVQSLIARIQAAQGPVVVDHGPAKGQDVFSQDFVNPPPVAQAITTPPPPGDPSTTPTIIPPAPEPTQKRTRRTKAEMEAARAAEAVTPPPDPGPVATGSAPQAVPVGGYTLYVDCVPSSDYMDVARAYDVAKKAVCEKSGKPDYRLVDYGGGPGLLAIAMEDIIDAGVLSGDVFVSTQSQETLACLAVLVKRASKVVRAVR